MQESRKLTWWGGPIPMQIDVAPARVCAGDSVVKVTASVCVATDVSAPESLSWRG